MNRNTRSQQGSVALVLVAVLVVVLIAGVGFFAWQKNKDRSTSTQKRDATSHKQSEQKGAAQDDETKNWSKITTQGGKFSMKVPDGWAMTAYPGDFLGSFNVAYGAGMQAAISTSNIEYTGHSLRFRVSIANMGDDGLGPQWSSPQPGLEELTQDFSIGTLNGRRYKAVFTGDIKQTLYQYLFDLGNKKKLDIVYTVNSELGEKDEVETVEKAIKTIQMHEGAKE